MRLVPLIKFQEVSPLLRKELHCCHTEDAFVQEGIYPGEVFALITKRATGSILGRSSLQ